MTSQQVRERQIAYDIPYIMEYLKVTIQMNLFTKQKQISRLRKQTYGCQRGGWGEWIVREFGMDMDTTAIFKMDKQQGPTV